MEFRLSSAHNDDRRVGELPASFAIVYSPRNTRGVFRSLPLGDAKKTPNIFGLPSDFRSVTCH
jgi:hypothetical protein